jgi:hypothetical protein
MKRAPAGDASRWTAPIRSNGKFPCAPVMMILRPLASFSAGVRHIAQEDVPTWTLPSSATT